eukprot:scaffold20394_cov109-Isochrysis_galbana.AAC.5
MDVTLITDCKCAQVWRFLTIGTEAGAEAGAFSEIVRWAACTAPHPVSAHKVVVCRGPQALQ